MNHLDVVYDLETYPNIFTFTVEHLHSPLTWFFEVSDWRDDTAEIIAYIDYLRAERARMIGFNNVGFDYPVLHLLYRMRRVTARTMADKATAIIHGSKDDRFAHMVYPSDRVVDQIDLFKIHHFDNAARATSLKALEFNMQSASLQDLPFPPTRPVTKEEAVILRKYNKHDVSETKKFAHHTKDQIEFRERLTHKYGDKKDWMNASDVKIGTLIFEDALQAASVPIYNYGRDGRQPIQTKRDSVALGQCIPDYIQFQHPEFNRVLEFLKAQVITETKGVFKNLKARVDGIDYKFGTGGIHASVSELVVESDSEHVIIDVDVTSMYPSIAIVNGYYPEHLSEKFIEVYQNLKDERLKYKKGTAENAAYKLALNGAYGKSNDKFSVFFDPKFTMQVTLTGQLALAMLADWLIQIDGITILQANTDGVTSKIKRDKTREFLEVCQRWEKTTGFALEHVNYRLMALADVNSYIAISDSGKVKRKGRYAHNRDDQGELGWHQDHSELVVPKVAEKVLVEGVPIRETVENWPEFNDFLCRIKVPRSGYLSLKDDDNHEWQEQNTCRFYVAKDGHWMTKWLPPIKKDPEKWRAFAVKSGWRVCVCNDLVDAKLPVNFDYYVEEVEKLVMRMK